MTIFCPNCGNNLPDDANFCMKCGTKQKSTVQQSEPIWETCEINMVEGYLTYQLRAEAVGPKGMYTAGVSGRFPLSGYWGVTGSRNKKLNTLVNQLIKDGWEPQGLGNEWWYSHRFRRKVNQMP